MGHGANLSCDTPEEKVEGRDVVLESLKLLPFLCSQHSLADPKQFCCYPPYWNLRTGNWWSWRISTLRSGKCLEFKASIGAQSNPALGCSSLLGLPACLPHLSRVLGSSRLWQRLGWRSDLTAGEWDI